MSEVADRAFTALQDLAERLGAGAGLVVSHDAVNSAVLAAINPSLGDPSSITRDTGCCNYLECDESG